VLLVATFAVALAVAALSWYLLERPLQRWKGALDGVAARG
jgi:peptidoglycan/LPS O-acetylase OafA/YrhL